MKTFILKKSNKENKKYMVKDANNNKIIHFGAKGYKDYIYYSKHNSDIAEIKKQNYIKRHSKNENWKDLYSAGFWSRFILWNKENIYDSIKYIENNFKIKIIYK